MINSHKQLVCITLHEKSDKKFSTKFFSVIFNKIGSLNAHSYICMYVCMYVCVCVCVCDCIFKTQATVIFIDRKDVSLTHDNIGTTYITKKGPLSWMIQRRRLYYTLPFLLNKELKSNLFTQHLLYWLTFFKNINLFWIRKSFFKRDTY